MSTSTTYATIFEEVAEVVFSEKEHVKVTGTGILAADFTVADHAFVGAGSVVIRDVPRHALVVGNPARQVGWLCVCGERIDADYRCDCGRAYRLIDEASGLAAC